MRRVLMMDEERREKGAVDGEPTGLCTRERTSLNQATRAPDLTLLPRFSVIGIADFGSRAAHRPLRTSRLPDLEADDLGEATLPYLIQEAPPSSLLSFFLHLSSTLLNFTSNVFIVRFLAPLLNPTFQPPQPNQSK